MILGDGEDALRSGLVLTVADSSRRLHDCKKDRGLMGDRTNGISLIRVYGMITHLPTTHATKSLCRPCPRMIQCVASEPTIAAHACGALAS